MTIVFDELSKGFLFFIHAIGGALAGFVASTAQTRSTDLPSFIPLTAMLIGAVIGTALWLANKNPIEER